MLRISAVLTVVAMVVAIGYFDVTKAHADSISNCQSCQTVSSTPGYQVVTQTKQVKTQRTYKAKTLKAKLAYYQQHKHVTVVIGQHKTPKHHQPVVERYKSNQQFLAAYKKWNTITRPVTTTSTVSTSTCQPGWTLSADGMTCSLCQPEQCEPTPTPVTVVPPQANLPVVIILPYPGAPYPGAYVCHDEAGNVIIIDPSIPNPSCPDGTTGGPTPPGVPAHS
jgi:hypothetical protein